MLEFYVISGWLLFLMVVILVVMITNWRDIKEFDIPVGTLMILILLFLLFAVGADHFMKNIKNYSDLLNSVPRIEKIGD